MVKGNRGAPAKTLERFEAEYCPYCRHVREALTELDLDAMIYPIPKGAKRHVASLLKLGGEKQQYPSCTTPTPASKCTTRKPL